ncbi:MAG: hypothetical protein ACW98I_04305 [Candidatus Hodarchaeales archaeon]|jgi:hypothetical protein
MKKKFITGISVIFLLILLTFTTPAQATDYAGHDFSEDHFAVEIDLFGTNAANPDVIYDFGTGVEGTDTVPETDLQFFMSYMNDSGIEVAYSALEKMEHWIKFRDLLPSDVGDLIDTLDALGTAPPGSVEALNTNLVHVNATAPFQQLVQHFNTPWGTDAFVTNNFMTLVAYSGGTGSDPLLMDSGDNLYMGYTFAVQEVAEALNTVLAPHYEIPPFDYEANFEQTADGYTFGINYTNMFVLWQDITVPLRGPDYLSAAGLELPETKGIIYGEDIVAASVLDHLAFEYIFTVEEIDLGTTPSIKVNLGTVETRYHIGETNLLVTRDDAAFITAHSSDWIGTPFTATPSYTLNVPSALQGQTVGSWTFPSSVTLTLSEMAFFINDDAKVRMSLADAFGLTVVTATNWFDTQVVSNPQYATHLDEPEDPTIKLEKDGNEFFWTSFKDKMFYKLRELDFAPFNIDPTTDRDVYVTLFDPSGWFAANVAKPYFIVEFSLAWAFTYFMATKVAPDIVHPGAGQHTEVINQFLYLTFTEFPTWYGGEIYHDPSYSAVAAVAAQSETTTDGPAVSDTTGLNIPGFELISVLVALPLLYTSYRKRR